MKNRKGQLSEYSRENSVRREIGEIQPSTCDPYICYNNHCSAVTIRVVTVDVKIGIAN